MLSGIPPAHLDQLWPGVEGIISIACNTTRGRWKPEDIKARVASGHMQLWTALDRDFNPIAAVVTEIINYPGKRVCCVMIGCGEQREEWQGYMRQIEAWAKDNGCQSIEAIARKGWARILDWDFTHVFIEKELTHG